LAPDSIGQMAYHSLLNYMPKDGEKFSETGVWVMLSFNGQILVTTAEDGLFLHDGQTFSRFKTAADTFLSEGLLYNTCRLLDGKLAFATRRMGVAILDEDGNGARFLTKENGLTGNVVFDVFDVFQDSEGGLWLATQDGITRVELNSPFTKLSQEKTANSLISVLHRFKSKLFAGIVLGTYYLDASQKSFQPIHGTKTFGNSFISIGNTFFVSDLEMIFSIDRNLKVHKLFDTNSAYLFQSAIDSNVIYAIDRTGFWMFRYEQGILTQILEAIPIDIELASLAEDGDGSLWIQTFYEGLYHVQSSAGSVFASTDMEQITFTLYDKEKGIPGKSCLVYTIEEKTRLATDAGLFRFEHDSKTFIPDTLLGKEFADGTYSLANIVKDYHRDLWIWAKTPEGFELGKAIKQDDGTFRWNAVPDFRRLDLNNVLTFYPEYDAILKKDIIWVSTNDGLFRYEPGNQKDPLPAQFKTIIRRVTVNQDSLLYGGTTNPQQEKAYVLTSENNNLLFKFSATSFDRTEANQFQYRLEGYEKKWSPWTTEVQKAYTNLSSGDYVFRVRSKNAYGAIGTTDSFTFKVLPPLYLT
jgi:ligand-binding sensor domain-containing protein